jgi:hypothetical protein
MIVNERRSDLTTVLEEEDDISAVLVVSCMSL